ncbi:TetR/AcrR family transcriptional regulator [Nesterenkonia suensis]
MAEEKSERRRLRAQDWIEAALTAIGRGGLSAVAVEPLATELGATKGSFYWHFSSRQALVDAALAHWEQHHTESVITAMDSIDRPAERLDELLAVVLDHRADPVEVALLAAAQEPAAGPVVARVTQRRIDYVASLYETAGHDGEAAYSAAVTAVATYLGHVQLAHATPAALPTGSRWTRHQERVRRLLRA